VKNHVLSIVDDIFRWFALYAAPMMFAAEDMSESIRRTVDDVAHARQFTPCRVATARVAAARRLTPMTTGRARY